MRVTAGVPIQHTGRNARLLKRITMTTSPTVRVAIVFHSGYGHTQRFAQAVAQGAQDAGARVLLTNVEQIDQYWNELEMMDAIIFGCPTYMGSASAPFKQFMDASSHRAFVGQKWQNKVAAGFTNAASRAGDKLHTLQQLAVFAAQHGMHWVNLGLQAGHNKSTTNEDTLNRHGYFIGAAGQSDADQPAHLSATTADLATSAHLGARVAMVARQLACGRALLA
jgi:NAD(P)H dehydrogenase (quinone)